MSLLFCRFYDRTKEEWVEELEGQEDVTRDACTAICLPEVYKDHKTIPNGIKTTKEQVDYLKINGFIQDPEEGGCNGRKPVSICSIM